MAVIGRVEPGGGQKARSYDPQGGGLSPAYRPRGDG